MEEGKRQPNSKNNGRDSSNGRPKNGLPNVTLDTITWSTYKCNLKIQGNI